MSKFYNKSDLTFKSGYVVSADGDVVALPPCVAEQLNEIETMVQKAAWYASQPEECAGPDPSEFVRESAFGSRPTVSVSTPLLDAKVEEGVRLDEELKAKLCADKVNELIGTFGEAFGFASEDSFVEGERVVRLDLPMLGDPLKLTANELAKALGGMAFEGEPEIIED